MLKRQLVARFHLRFSCAFRQRPASCCRGAGQAGDVVSCLERYDGNAAAAPLAGVQTLPPGQVESARLRQSVSSDEADKLQRRTPQHHDSVVELVRHEYQPRVLVDGQMTRPVQLMLTRAARTAEATHVIVTCNLTDTGST